MASYVPTEPHPVRAWSSFTPEPDGRIALTAAFALSAIEDTYRTAIWISMGLYLLAVGEQSALSQRTPKRLGRATLRAVVCSVCD